MQACAQIEFGVEDNRVRLKGTDRDEDGSLAASAGASAGVFAGLRAGGEVSGRFEWQNPEENQKVAGQPPAEPTWSCFAKAGYEGEGLIGGALEGDFHISFEGGKFIIKAKAAFAFGGGASGAFLFSVNADEINEFVMFVYHKLKEVDFDYLGIIEQVAFDTLNDLLTYVVWAGKELSGIYEVGQDAVDVAQKWLLTKVSKFSDEVKAQQAAEDLAKRILAHPERVRFLPPEAKGRLLRSLCPTTSIDDEKEQEGAIITILKTVQTWRDFCEVMEHMTLDGRRIMTKEEEKSSNKPAWRKGEELLYNILDLAQHWEYERLKKTLKEKEWLLAKASTIQTSAIQQDWMNGMA